MVWLPLFCLSAAPVPTRVDGGLPLAVVSDEIAFRRAEFASCWDKPKGDVEADWWVSDAGTVEQVRVAATRPPAVAVCLDAQLKQLEFPPAPAATWVTHRLTPAAKPWPAEVEGGPTPVSEAQRAEVLACYAAARGANPTLEGRLTIRLTVGPSGAVLARAVEEGTEGVKASSAPACILEAARGWSFGPDRPRRVLQPFLLAGSKAFADLQTRPDEPGMVVVLAPAPDAGPRGGLSKGVIATEIKRHQNEIKFCFEQQLQQLPDLKGKVTVHFWIDGGGRVAEATVTETTLKNPAVEQCMIGRIRKWKFPEPDGGGRVDVTFPWIFKTAQGDD